MSTKKDISRRKFLRITGLAGSGTALTAIRAGYADWCHPGGSHGPGIATCNPADLVQRPAVTSKAYVYLLPVGMAG